MSVQPLNRHCYFKHFVSGAEAHSPLPIAPIAQMMENA